jgi:hypothetical protein
LVDLRPSGNRWLPPEISTPNYEQLDVLLNKSQRILDELARELVRTQLAPVEGNIETITRATGIQ